MKNVFEMDSVELDDYFNRFLIVNAHKIVLKISVVAEGHYLVTTDKAKLDVIMPVIDTGYLKAVARSLDVGLSTTPYGYVTGLGTRPDGSLYCHVDKDEPIVNKEYSTLTRGDDLDRTLKQGIIRACKAVTGGIPDFVTCHNDTELSHMVSVLTDGYDDGKYTLQVLGNLHSDYLDVATRRLDVPRSRYQLFDDGSVDYQDLLKEFRSITFTRINGAVALTSVERCAG